VCASRCRTSTFPLPAVANSGQYRPTGAARSRSPRSARTSAHSAVIVLVTDQTLVIVFRCHGIVRSESANPPQTSTTGSPSTKTATEAPASPSSSNPASALGTAVNRSSYEPWISAMRRISAHCPRQGQSNWPIDGGGVVALGPHPPGRTHTRQRPATSSGSGAFARRGSTPLSRTRFDPLVGIAVSTGACPSSPSFAAGSRGRRYCPGAGPVPVLPGPPSGGSCLMGFSTG
jgi:hypothetical protein